MKRFLKLHLFIDFADLPDITILRSVKFGAHKSLKMSTLGLTKYISEPHNPLVATAGFFSRVLKCGSLTRELVKEYEEYLSSFYSTITIRKYGTLWLSRG